jgi:NAD-specific glutamate dehydrogenase
VKYDWLYGLSLTRIRQAVIDLLIPSTTPGIRETLVDLYNKPEILFFGPDEGTADLMDWAASKFHLFQYFLVTDHGHA